MLLGFIVAGLVPSVPPAFASPSAQATETVTSAVAYQGFEHGWMLWREDTDRILVSYTDIRTKTDKPCQELYRDTFEGQAYEIPPAPPGLMVPSQGFGWLYANDQEMAKRLGYAKTEEFSRVATITTKNEGGSRTMEADWSGDSVAGGIVGVVGSDPDEPGLTYCFPRRQENRSVLNTWISYQFFQYGWMVWRQDKPDRIEVIHQDTQLAPEIWCVDTITDTWRPGQEIDYGALAVPNRRLPVRGFGKIWAAMEYVNKSLGYAVSPEAGGFAEVTWEPFQHPMRGTIQVRKMVIHAPTGDINRQTTFPNGGGPEGDGVLSTACEQLLIPHQPGR